MDNDDAEKSDFDEIDFFTDDSIVGDPYPYFEHLRSTCPVLREPHQGVIAVSGYAEAVEVYRDPDTYSSCNSVTGPFPGLPVEPEGDDISDLIAEHRHVLPMHEHMVTMDPPEHTQRRQLLMRLITPKRLRDNEDFMWRLADQQLDEFIAGGSCEFISAFAQPFGTSVIADLLGVPEGDHRLFQKRLGIGTPGGLDADDDQWEHLNPLEFLETWFRTYVEDRRESPKDDVLGNLAAATHPDGSIPDVLEVVRTATFLFAAGQETSARLLACAVKYLAEEPELQDRLRENRDVIPGFIEEALRIESPVKSDFRLARRNTSLAGVDIPAGTTVMLLNGAANRDPERFECPAEFRADRPNVMDHIAFGRGVHACPGGPLARAEGRISIERILDRTRDIRLSEEHHGSPGDRRFDYIPTYILRGLTELHIEFTPVEA
jgi:cytochrome P450